MDCDLYLSILKRRLASDGSSLLPLNRVVLAHVVECLETALKENAELAAALETYACDCKELCNEHYRKEYYCGAGAREALGEEKEPTK